MLDGAQRRRGHAQPHRTSERVGNQRDIAEVWQEPGTRLAVRMADQIAGLHGFAGKLTTAGHEREPSCVLAWPEKIKAGHPRREAVESFREGFCRRPVL